MFTFGNIAWFFDFINHFISWLNPFEYRETVHACHIAIRNCQIISETKVPKV